MSPMPLRRLARRLRALLAPRRVERDLDDELSFHLEREARRLVEQGFDPAVARRLARVRFGSPALVADECRDERGTAFIDGVRRDIVYALRTVRRAPMATATIVLTIALGLGLVAVIFTVFNTLVFRVDQVPDVHELYAVERPRTPDGGRMPFTRPDHDALDRETRVFAGTYAALPDVDSRIDGRMMAGTLVSGRFFGVLGVPAALGRSLAPADDDRAAPRRVLVLSHRGWTRLFANDPAVVGRELLVGGRPYAIVGVMPEGFRGLSVGPPDYWAPLSLVAEFRPVPPGREDLVGIEIAGRLASGMSPQAAAAALTAWEAGRRGGRPAARGPATVTLEPRRGTVPQPAEALLLFTPLFFAFGLILLIGCANVANLLLARGIARQREIGIRLSLGASRGRIVRQLVTESLLVALVSAALGFVISRIALEATLSAVTSTLAPELAEVIRLSAPAADWRVIVFLVTGAVLSTMMFGLAPALQATRIELVRTMRGEVTRDGRPGRARHALIGLQVGASALLLIPAAVFLRSALVATTVDPGIRTADTIVIEMTNEPAREAMLRAVTADPAVAAVAASWPDPMGAPRAALADTPAGRMSVAFRLVSPNYFDVLAIDVIRGRHFTPVERDVHAGVAIVSERTASRLWPATDAVGQMLRLEPDPASPTRRRDEPALPARTFAVVGVARDVAGFRLAGFEEAGIYLPAGAAMSRTSLTVRVHGDPEQARLALVRRLTAVDPNMGQIMTMRTLARMETYLLQAAFWLTFVLGGLALVLTVSGLFGVLSYVVAQRTRELGIRLALGATPRDVARLVVSQSLVPVGAGLAAGGGLAAALATALLATPAAATIGAIVRVLDPLAYGSSLLTIVAACLLAATMPAVRAARVDPLTTLRHE